MSENHIFCERCGQLLNKKRIVWLELSNTDGHYYNKIPEGHVSQGSFSFGTACSNSELKQTLYRLLEESRKK